MSAANRAHYGIDAGGSRTSVQTWDGERWDLPTLNPSSSTRQAADRSLTDLFARIGAHARRKGTPAGGTSLPPAIWLATASVAPSSVADEERRCVAAAVAVGLGAELLLSNDVTPLILGTPLAVGHVVTVCGTGTGFVATDGCSGPVWIGGCEYLGSDEGSAFDLGLGGLRAAVRGLDARGERTALSGMLAGEAGTPVPDLARRLARMPFPKSAVAALAPVVLRAWLGGDQVSARLVDAAIRELARGVRTARDSAALAPGWRLSVTGGVVNGCQEFYRRLVAAGVSLGADHVTKVSDPAAATLAALKQLTSSGSVGLTDPRIESCAWHVRLEGDSHA